MDLPVIDAAIDLASPIDVVRPTRQTAPLVFASGHSGQSYSAAFIGQACLDAQALRRSEDSFVDELFADAPSHGAPLLRAKFPRAFCDPNRERWELDPAMFDDRLPPWVNTTSPRVGAGLGTIPRVVSSGEAIYRRKLPFAEAEARVRACWDPYHEALAGLIGETLEMHGGCLVVDCHSMPSASNAPRGDSADIVLGDAHGRSCAPAITRFVEETLAGSGLSVRRNDPYAGGFVTRHYGAPETGVHVLQIEIARHLYMDEARIAKTARFDGLRCLMSELQATLSAQAFACSGWRRPR